MREQSAQVGVRTRPASRARPRARSHQIGTWIVVMVLCLAATAYSARAQSPPPMLVVTPLVQVKSPGQIPFVVVAGPHKHCRPTASFGSGDYQRVLRRRRVTAGRRVMGCAPNGRPSAQIECTGGPQRTPGICRFTRRRQGRRVGRKTLSTCHGGRSQQIGRGGQGDGASPA